MLVPVCRIYTVWTTWIKVTCIWMSPTSHFVLFSYFKPFDKFFGGTVNQDRLNKRPRVLDSELVSPTTCGVCTQKQLLHYGFNSIHTDTINYHR